MNEHLPKLESIFVCVFVGVMVFIGILCNEYYVRRIERARMTQPGEWTMVWSNSAACPVAIARETNGMLQELGVDWKAFKP